MGGGEDGLCCTHTLNPGMTVQMVNSLLVAFHSIQRISKWCRASSLAAEAKRVNS